MDIIFQSGDFFNESSWFSILIGPIATLISVIISAIIAIYLFNKGIEKDRKLANEQREKDYQYNRDLEALRYEKEKQLIQEQKIQNIERYRIHFVELLTSCIKTSRDQVEEYKRFTKVQSENLLEKHYDKKYQNEFINRLLISDTQLMLDCFVHKQIEIKEFTNTLSSLSFLKIIFETIPNDINKKNGEIIINLSNKLIRTRNKILKIASDYLNEQININSHNIEDPLFKILNQILLDYYKNNNGIPDIKLDYEILINTIKAKLIEKPYRDNDICNKLLNLAKEGGDIVFTIKQMNIILCENINDAITRINESIDKLEEIKNKLNK